MADESAILLYVYALYNSLLSRFSSTMTTPAQIPENPGESGDTSASEIKTLFSEILDGAKKIF